MFYSKPIKKTVKTVICFALVKMTKIQKMNTRCIVKANAKTHIHVGDLIMKHINLCCACQILSIDAFRAVCASSRSRKIGSI